MSVNHKMIFCILSSIQFISRSFTNDNRRAVQRSNLNNRIVQQPQASLKNLFESPVRMWKIAQSVTPHWCRYSFRKRMWFTKWVVISEGEPILVTQADLWWQDFKDIIAWLNRPAKSYKNIAFWKHYKDHHLGVKPVNVLKKIEGSLQRKITEALYIREL